MTTTAEAALWWVRRDLRLRDNPALLSAAATGPVLPVFVLDPALLRRAGPVRTAWLIAALTALDSDLRDHGAGGLSVLRGRPVTVIPQLARAVEATAVHVSADFGPYGRKRDEAVRTALANSGRRLIATGSPYAVAPGTLTNGSGTPYQVFSPFFRAWSEHGVHEPATTLRHDRVEWLAAPAADRVELDPDPALAAVAGEEPARRQWRSYLGQVGDYERLHDVPGADATSHLSVALRWGHLHPRTVLADLAPLRSKGAAALRRQLAWRDFFADVLFHRPDAVSRPIRAEYRRLPTDDPEHDAEARRRLTAWQQGRTGYPLVDAGMRQLLAEGWMHNRVRMVVASFLVKDLHLGWWHGADWFLQHLRDGDIAQNQLNWQWVAGCGTDAAPYVRVFNPTTQARTFAADGRYIRRYVPELAEVPLDRLHEPWAAPDGGPASYPGPIVDHAAERKEALARFEVIRRVR